MKQVFFGEFLNCFCPRWLVHILAKMASSPELPFHSDIARTRSRNLSSSVADLYVKFVFELQKILHVIEYPVSRVSFNLPRQIGERN